jgi:hypothetical protein
LISNKFEEEIVFKSSVLAWIRIRNRIRIELKCGIRIRKKSIRIHNPVLKGQSHEKFGEMRARGLSLGHNLESLWVFKFF